jgi:hypothetical protein
VFLNAQPDRLWQHTPGIWALDVAMLVMITTILAIITWSRLRLKKSAA